MRIRRLFVLAAALGFGTAAFAQDYAKVEVSGDYSFMRFNPENSQILSGFSLNGGGGSVVVYINHWLGIQGDMQGYASTTRTFNFPATANSPCPTGCTVRASGDLFTYNTGFVAKHRFEHFEPFVETLFGGAHTNSYQNIQKACQLECVTAANPSNNAWDFIIGGGIDIPLSKSLAIRPAQFDFVLTRFGNAYTAGNNNQSNFRYNAGIVFRF